MRITSKGQVTIPRDVRESAGLTPGTEVEFDVKEGVVRLHKSPRPGASSRGRKFVSSLRGRGDFKMSTDEFIALMRGPAPEV